MIAGIEMVGQHIRGFLQKIAGAKKQRKQAPANVPVQMIARRPEREVMNVVENTAMVRVDNRGRGPRAATESLQQDLRSGVNFANCFK